MEMVVFRGISCDFPSGNLLYSCGLDHHATGKTHHVDWAIFNSYVELPEGIWKDLRQTL